MVHALSVPRGPLVCKDGRFAFHVRQALILMLSPLPAQTCQLVKSLMLVCRNELVDNYFDRIGFYINYDGANNYYTTCTSAAASGAANCLPSK
jgi:hypothetical protein